MSFPQPKPGHTSEYPSAIESGDWPLLLVLDNSDLLPSFPLLCPVSVPHQRVNESSSIAIRDGEQLIVPLSKRNVLPNPHKTICPFVDRQKL